MRSLLLILSVLGGMSCAVRSPLPPPGPSPLAWRLVESPTPGGPELVLESYDPTASVRVAIRFAREFASVGEVVEAEVTLPDAVGLHLLEIQPDRPGVKILGATEVWTDGASPVNVLFTCTTPGRGGISVLVRE